MNCVAVSPSTSFQFGCGVSVFCSMEMRSLSLCPVAPLLRLVLMLLLLKLPCWVLSPHQDTPAEQLVDVYATLCPRDMYDTVLHPVPHNTCHTHETCAKRHPSAPNLSRFDAYEDELGDPVPDDFLPRAPDVVVDVGVGADDTSASSCSSRSPGSLFSDIVCMVMAVNVAAVRTRDTQKRNPNPTHTHTQTDNRVKVCSSMPPSSPLPRAYSCYECFMLDMIITHKSAQPIGGPQPPEEVFPPVSRPELHTPLLVLTYLIHVTQFLSCVTADVRSRPVSIRILSPSLPMITTRARVRLNSLDLVVCMIADAHLRSDSCQSTSCTCLPMLTVSDPCQPYTFIRQRKIASSRIRRFHLAPAWHSPVRKLPDRTGYYPACCFFLCHSRDYTV